MDRFKCREAIVADLEKNKQPIKIEQYAHAIGHASVVTQSWNRSQVNNGFQYETAC